MRQNAIRIVMVDEHRLLTEALAWRINQEADLKVVGIATDDEEGWKLAHELQPDILAMHLCVRRQGCLRLAHRVGLERPQTRFLFMTGHVSNFLLEQALRCRGIHGCFDMGEHPDEFIDALRRVAIDELYFSQVLRHRLSYNLSQQRFQVAEEPAITALTARQIEVLRHLASGRSVKEVARTVHLSDKSIESHKYRIMKKLEIRDRVELARYAIREGLVQP